MWLCHEIIQKYYALVQQGIEHNYLSTDRIWLKLKPGTEKFRIIYSHLHYNVHFVGYKCPFYEKSDYEQYQIKDESAVYNIVSEILIVQQKYLRRSVLEKAKEKNIFIQLNQSINQGLCDFQMQVISIIDENVKLKEKKEKLKENTFSLTSINQDQRLSEIDRHYIDFSYNRRGRRTFDVSKNISKIVANNYDQTNWYLFEVLFYKTVPLLVGALKEKLKYKKVKPNFKIPQKKPHDFLEIEAETLDNLIKEQEEKKNQKFKFDLEPKELKSNLLSHISNAKTLLHYFDNNVEFTIKFDDQIKDQIVKIKKGLIEDYVIQIYEEMKEQKLLELLQDLI